MTEWDEAVESGEARTFANAIVAGEFDHDCPSCQGCGMVHPSHECPRCYGSGVMPIEDVAQQLAAMVLHLLDVSASSIATLTREKAVSDRALELACAQYAFKSRRWNIDHYDGPTSGFAREMFLEQAREEMEGQ